MIRKKNSVNVFDCLKHAVPFRFGFLYNSWAYELADDTIERLVGEFYGDFLTRHVFQPLGILRTSIHPMQSQDEKFAKAYTSLDDGTLYHSSLPTSDCETVIGSTGCIR